MTIKEYQQQATRTNADLGSEKLNLAHMVLGIFSEWNELNHAIINDDKVNISEEIADHFWYLANYCTLRGIDLEKLVEDYNLDLAAALLNEHEMPLLSSLYTNNLSKLQDIVKKYVAYNKSIDTKKEISCIQLIFLYLCCYTYRYKIDVNQALENNINKLKVRFPDKFTEELANNRDLETERETLSKNVN